MAQLFPMSYGSVRMLIKRLGLKVQNSRVTPHILRHSSATYYANRIKNRYKLCYRYGWAMSSNMVDRYLDREGILEEETPDLIKADEVLKASKLNRELGEELALVKDSHFQLEKELQDLKRKLNEVQAGKGFISLLMNLTKQQDRESAVLGKLIGQGFDAILPFERKL